MLYSKKPFETAPKQETVVPESTENVVFAQARYYFERSRNVAAGKEDGPVYWLMGLTVLETYAGIVGISRDEAVSKYQKNRFGGGAGKEAADEAVS